MKDRLKIHRIVDKFVLEGNISKKAVKIIAGVAIITISFTSLSACSSKNYANVFDDIEDYSIIEDSEYNSDDDEYEYDFDFGYEQDSNNYESNLNDDLEYGDLLYDDYSKNYIDKNELNRILGLDVKFDETKLSSFQNLISKIKVKYKHSNKFNIDDSIREYNKLAFESSSETSNKIIKNNQISFNDLYSVIKKNNSEYLKKNEGDEFYKKLDDSILNETVQYIVDAINYNIKNNKNIDLKVLDYKLFNLKVFEYLDFGYAFYSQDDIAMALNLSVIPSKSNDKVTSLQEIVTHETNHIVQDSTIKKDKNIEQNYGFCYQFKNLDINALYWNWFVEATAQNNVLKQKNMDISDSLIYDSNIKALNSLNLVSYFTKTNNEDLSFLMSQGNLDELFNYFGCKTQEEKEEILNLMVSYNLLIDSSDLIFSSGFYEKNSNIDSYTYEKELQNSIGQTLTKLFYKNLAEKLKNKTVKIDDIFSLISIFETDLSYSVWYSSSENYEYLDEFYDNYKKIQGEFFELLANSIGVSIDDVNLYYSSYHNIVDQNDIDNSLLTPEQEKYYENLYKSNKLNKSNTVVEIADKIEKTGTIIY